MRLEAREESAPSRRRLASLTSCRSCVEPGLRFPFVSFLFAGREGAW